MYEARTYRKKHTNTQLFGFELRFLETDLWVGIDSDKYTSKMNKYIFDLIIELRTKLVAYNALNTNFFSSLEPLEIDKHADEIIQHMMKAAKVSNTGPMSCVAGIFAQYIGRNLKKEFHLDNVIVENGGDNYLSIENIDVTIPIGIKNNVLDQKLGIKINAQQTPIGICSSSGKFGHSHSFGKADLVTVVSKNIALADAYATSICNKIKTKRDLDDIITQYSYNNDIEALIIVMNGNVGMIGEHEVVFL